MTYYLLPYEFEAMLEALRRDLSRQSELAMSQNSSETRHASNVRLLKRILEVLNPKGPVADARVHAITYCLDKSVS